MVYLPTNLNKKNQPLIRVAGTKHRRVSIFLARGFKLLVKLTATCFFPGVKLKFSENTFLWILFKCDDFFPTPLANNADNINYSPINPLRGANFGTNPLTRLKGGAGAFFFF